MVSDIKSIVDILYRIKSAMYATGEDANHGIPPEAGGLVPI